MTNPDTKWTAISPGLLSLPTTKFLIEYVPGNFYPFRTMWDGKPIPFGAHTTLVEAQNAAEKHMAELITMGFEV